MSQEREGNQKAKTNLIPSVVAPILIAALGVGAGLFYEKSQRRIPPPGAREFAPVTVTAQIVMNADKSCYQVVDPTGSAILTGFPWMHEPQGSPAGDMIQWTGLDSSGKPAQVDITFPTMSGGNVGTPFYDGAVPKYTISSPVLNPTVFGPTGYKGRQNYGDFYFSAVKIGGTACTNIRFSTPSALGEGPMGVHVDK